jgi:hypothetical protein
VWAAASDPFLIGEVIADHGSITVRRGLGNFSDWPAGITGTAGSPSLSFVSNAYQGPRSTRAAANLTRTLSPGTELTVGGVFRHTTMLPRRADLNLASVPVTRDQHGRAVYGQLQKQGGLLIAASGSNRRFDDFDRVSAISADGWSDYRALEAALRASVSNNLQLQARYTYSQTEDNWFMARANGGVSAPAPFPDDSTNSWSEGRSDFDSPHRAVVGAELMLPVLQGLKIAALYRFQSGYPFTPAFRTGVDANGDGSLHNDPAFLDAGVTGFDEVAARWPCLQQQRGNFAERNSCRGPASSFLDARVALGLFRSAGLSAELVVDGLNILVSGGQVDPALYLVDAQRALTTTADRVTVPLIINGQFGETVLRASGSRMLRVGLRVQH